MSATMDRAIRRTLQNEYRRQTRKRMGGDRGAAQPGQVGGGGAVTVAGQLFQGSGINAPVGATVAVRNAGRPANALFVPDNASVAIYVAGAGGSGGGAGGDVPNPHSYSAYHSGTIPDAHAPQFLKLDGTRALEGNLAVNPGVTLDGVDLSAFKALYDVHITLPDAHHKRVTVGDGLSVDSDQLLNLKLKPASALEKDDTGLSVAGSIAGAGLGWNDTTKVASVAHDTSLQIVSDQVGVNKAHNFVWTGNHTFQVGTVTFHTSPQVNANINFIGPVDRFITAADDLYLQPDDDLWLNPGGFVMLSDTTEIRTGEIVDLPTGIRGLRLFERPDALNYWQLTMGAAKFDELYARVFVADETRIDRGEEYWSKGFGIVQESFEIPATGANVDVWFENAAETQTQNLFSVGDWLLLRVIDWDTGLLIVKCWFQVVSLLTSGAAGDATRQRWRLVRKKFGVTGVEVKPGNTILDAGKPGQGWIHLSVLGQDAGPFLQIGEFVAVVDDEPVFEPRVRMGNLSGTADYGANDAWGFITGNNLGLEPDEGFSGMASDAANGVRLFNTNIELYDLGDLSARMNKDTGLRFLVDGFSPVRAARQIGWHDDLDNLSAFPRAVISSYGSTSSLFQDRVLDLRVATNATSNQGSLVRLQAISHLGNALIDVHTENAGSSRVELRADRVYATQKFLVTSHANLYTLPVSTFEVYESSTAINASAGATITQASTGDAVLHWRLTNGRYYSAGIDNSDGDKFKISASQTLGINDAIVIDPATGVVTVNGLSGSGTGTVDLVAGDGLTLVGTNLSVNDSIARATRNLIAGDGLTGGGNLSADRTFAVDATVVRATRNLIAGHGLTGGGALNADRSFAVQLAANSGLTVGAGGLAISSGVAGEGIAFSGGVLSVSSAVVKTDRLIETLPPLDGGGTLANNLVLKLNLATNSGLSTSGGLGISSAIAGDGLVISAEKVLSVASDVVRTSRQINTGSGLTGGGNLTANRTLSVDSTIARSAITISAGAGLQGGGNLTANRTLSVALATNSGLETDGGLQLSDGVAGDGLIISAAKVLGVAPDVVRTSRVVATLGPLAGGGDLSDNLELSLVFAEHSGLDEGEELAIADSVAGAGLAISALKVLSVNAADGLRLDGDDVVVDLSHNFAWIGNHAFSVGTVTFDTTPQVAANLHFANEARSITGDGNLTLIPTGDLILAPDGGDILPAGSGSIDLGDYNRKFRTIYAAEIYSETLVPQNVTATLGGRILVGMTTTLAADLDADASAMITVNNNLLNGAYVRLESAPGGVHQFEVVRITSLPTPTAGGFQYSITRNANGSLDGPHDWSIGDAAVSLGSMVGAGYIDLTSAETIHEHLGPTLTVYTRYSMDEWDDVSPVVSLGNLSSFIDYGSTEFGFAVGNDLTLDGSSGFSGLTADRTNGMRLFNTDIQFFEAGEPILKMASSVGLAMEAGENDDPLAFLRRISWYDDLSSINTQRPLAFVQASPVDGTGRTWLSLVSGYTDGVASQNGIIDLQAINDTSSTSIYIADSIIFIRDSMARMRINPANLILYGTTHIAPDEGSVHLGGGGGNVYIGHTGGEIVVGEASSDVFVGTGTGKVTVSRDGGELLLGLAGGDVVIARDGGSVGIGTATPTSVLQVKSRVGKITPGPTNLLKLTSWNDPDQLELIFNLIGSATASERKTSIQSVEQGIAYRDLLLNPAGGNVGIGTTSPLAKLHASNGAYGGTPHVATGLLVEGNDNAAITIATPNTATGYLFFGDPESGTSGQVRYSHVDNAMGFVTSNALRMYLNNIGLGIHTAEPQAPLEVAGNLGGIFITRTGNVPYIGFRTGGGTITPLAQIRGVAGGGLSFTEGTSTPEWARFDAAGNFGVGTASPRGKLHVHDGTSGELFGTYVVAGTEIQVIPDGAGDVVRGLSVRAVAYDTTGAFLSSGVSSMPTPGAGSTQVSVGTDVALRLYSTGRVTLVRTGGGATHTVTLDLLWQ